MIYAYDESAQTQEKLGEIGRGNDLLDVPIDVVADRNMVLKFGVG